MTATATPQATAAETAPNPAAEAATKVPPPADDQSNAALLEAVSAAAAMEGGEVPPEAAKETPAEPDKLAVAAETLKKARKIAKSRREAEARADRERLRADQFAQRAELSAKEIAEARAEREALKADPLAAIRKMGVTARDLAKKAIAEGTPEAQFAALEAKAAADLAAARAEMRAEFEAALKARDQQAQIARERAEFFGMIKQETHPNLHRLRSNEEIVEAMSRTAYSQAQRNGYNPTAAQVLAQVERLLSAPQSVNAGTSTAQPNPSPTAAKPVAKPSPTSRTITADLAGRRYTTPANIEDLDLSSQKEALARMLEDAERQGS